MELIDHLIVVAGPRTTNAMRDLPSSPSTTTPVRPSIQQGFDLALRLVHSLPCGHTYCESCTRQAFQEQFRRQAAQKLSRIFTHTVTYRILQAFPITDLAKFELFLTIFVTLRRRFFVQQMMSYHCPFCRTPVTSLPKLFPVLSGVASTMRDQDPVDDNINTLFLDPSHYESRVL